MTDATLGGRAFEPPPLRPPWLRPSIIVLVLALHAAALSILPYFQSKPAEPPTEVIIDIQPEAPPLEAPAPPQAPEAESTPPPQPAPPPEPAPPVVEAPPPVVEAPPPVSMSPPPPPEPPPAPPPETPPPPPAPAEPEPPQPSPAPPRVEPPKPPPKPAAKPAQTKPTPVQSKPAQAPKPAHIRAEKPAAAPAMPAAPASAASQSAYVSAMSAAIRSRLFYPPAARARGAKGIVGVAFTIGASGALTSFAITHSSGDEDLDAAARNLVQSAHFPPPPAGPVHVSTSFNYVPR